MEKKKKNSGPVHRNSGKSTPTGVAPVFSRTARFRRESTDRLLNLFSLWGYREIILPSFEYLDAISPGVDPALLPKLYIMQDRGSGQILVLRPDATAQIARLTTQSFQDRQLPLRFCYSTSVFRDENHQNSRDRELHQTGLELLGDPSVISDFEILELALTGGAVFPLKKPVLVLSHAGIQEGFFQGVTHDPEELKEVRRAYYSRNGDCLAGILDRLSGGKETRREMSGLSGEVRNLPEALKILSSLARKQPGVSSGSIDSFKDLLRMIAASRYSGSVLVDFALPPPGPYYTGMFFQIFAEDSPTHLASGGRYDHLGQAFGHDLPAVGFAFHVNHIEEALRKRESFGEPVLVLACYQKEDFVRVKGFSETLRKQAIPVFLAPDDFLHEKRIQGDFGQFFEDHQEIGSVVFFDRGKNVWTFRNRSRSVLSDPSLDRLGQLLLQSEIR